MLTVFLWGCAAGTVATLAALLAMFGPRRLGQFLVAFSDALESVQMPMAAPETRAQVVAALVDEGFDVDEANDAVSESANGPRTVRAWKSRALRVLRASR